MSARFRLVSRSGERLGFATDAIDPLIEEIEHDDWKATNPVAALRRSVAVFDRRAVGEFPISRTR